MLEGVLGKKHPTQTCGTPSDSDEEPVAKQAKLCKTPDKLISLSTGECVLSTALEDNDQIDSFIKENSIQLNRAAASDADSEGSEPDTQQSSNKSAIGLASVKSTDALPVVVQHSVKHTMETNGAIDRKSDVNGENIALDFEHRKPILQGTPPAKRERQSDSSKFNRSNRKSKNCAIFYFRHLDTDNENKEFLSSAASQAKSDASSDAEEWQYFIGNKRPSISEELPEQLKQLDHSMDFNGSANMKMVPQDYRSARNLPNNWTTNDGGTVSNDNENQPAAGTNLNQQYLRETIQQLVMDAETLVREEILQKSPMLCAKPFPDDDTLNEAIDEQNKFPAQQKIKRIQEWLKHQPIGSANDINQTTSAGATDCEASGEYTESDSSEHRSDSSEEPTNSITTCMQEELNSQCTGIDIVDGSLDALSGKDPDVSVNQLKTIIRTKRKNTIRPWSVSCLSQLTQSEHMKGTNADGSSPRLASYSISESALNTLSSPTATNMQNSSLKNINNSKSSLKKKKVRARKLLGNKNSGSQSNASDEGNIKQKSTELIKSESFSGRSVFQGSNRTLTVPSSPHEPKPIAVDVEHEDHENGAEHNILKPEFQLGAQTTFFGSNCILKRNNPEKDGKDLSLTGTDNSNFSEQAWDAYQEKYMSEPYSEGFDSDAARRLLEFGDDYRNFLDSQSDCCSSLSAANNFDSLSPKDKYLQFHYKNNKTAAGKLPKCDEPSNIALRRRRTLALEYERRKRVPDSIRKNSLDECRKSPGFFANTSMKCLQIPSSYNMSERKSSLDINKRKVDNDSPRRKLKSNEKLLYSMKSSTSPSENDSGDESEIKTLLLQSKHRLENTKVLKIRQHLLRPDDHKEIISTCRDNIRCFESIMKGSKSCVLSKVLSDDIQELHSSWKNLLQWSENITIARCLELDMCNLISAINKLGSQNQQCDSQSSIQRCIDTLKSEECELQKYRSTMLQLNASVHSWLTREEIKIMKQNAVPISNSSGNLAALITIDQHNPDHKPSSDDCYSIKTLNSKDAELVQIQSIDIPSISVKLDGNFVDVELHKRLKNDVGEMYKAYDEADQRISCQLENLTASLTTWKQFENALNDFREALGKDKGTLKGLKGALENGNEFANHLAHDVKEVAKRLSETFENNFQQINIEEMRDGHLNKVLPVTLKSFSNGSLSDSGMSDGGTSSDYALFEREKRLSALRRLAKQLELALAPGSAALISIEQRVKAAEEELRSLQQTCRELIVKTATSQQPPLTVTQKPNNDLSTVNVLPDVITPVCSIKTKPKKSPQCKCKHSRQSGNIILKSTSTMANISSSDPDPYDSSDTLSPQQDDRKKSHWIWRIIKWMLPFHFILFVLIIASYFFEPHCCDNLNNFSMSFTPQLRYLSGRPPV